MERLATSFALFVLTLLSAILVAPRAQAQIEPTAFTCNSYSGQVATATTWSPANCPSGYIITGNVLVNQGITLTILPGTQVKFNNDQLLTIEGTLVARGTDASRITFTSNQATPAAGDWKGIVFNSSSANATFDAAGNYTGGSILQYALIEYAGAASTPAIQFVSASPYLDRNTVRNNKYHGVVGDFESEMRISNNIISNNQEGMRVSGYKPVRLYGNTIRENASEAIYVMGTPVHIEKNIVTSNGDGLFVFDRSTTESGSITSNLITENIYPGSSALMSTGAISVIGNIIIQGNTVTNNEGTGGINVKSQGVIINQNNIYGNTWRNPIDSKLLSRNLVTHNHNSAYPPVDARNNWWGTADVASIEAGIIDYSDSTGYQAVLYEPFLDKPASTLPILSPSLVVNYSTGQPGSYFTFVGSDFPPQSLIAVLENGRSLGTMQTDATGHFTFILAAAQAAAGNYTLTASAQNASQAASATAYVTLDPMAALRPKEGSGTEFNLSGAQNTDTWKPTSSMQTGRAWHTATVLADGRVLVAGGSPGEWGQAQNSAEIYNPATGSWSATGSMTAARFLHSATLLPNGKVLVAGGEGAGWMSSAELYDPATGTWAATGSMHQGRSMHSATLLPNGKVLVAGGYGRGDLASAEIYDPATGTWTTTGSMKTARMHHPAVLLLDGNVLVCGGTTFSGAAYPPLASAEIYNPASGQWSETGSLQQARHNHQALLLANGKVLAAAGSGAQGTNGVVSAELYDPTTRTWTLTGELQEPHAHVGPLAVLLTTGKVLISGGYNLKGQPSVVTEVYDPATGAWSRVSDMKAARYEQANTILQDGRVLATGGYKGVASAEIYTALADLRFQSYLPFMLR